MEQTEQKHTPTPWRQASIEKGDEFTCRILEDSRSLEPYRIATTHIRRNGEFDYEEAEANAAYIVKCVNSHAQLVAALTACRSALELMLNPLDEEERNQPVFLRLRVAKEMARVALSAATKEGSK